ncbi:MAG: carbohydrate-binding protein, partial [Moraxellaceae bacterium]
NGTTGLSGRYYVKNRNSGLYLDVQDWSVQNGAKVLQWHYHGGTNQQFDLVDQGNGAYALKNVNSGKSFDISGISADNGAGLLQWDFVGGGNQKFVAHKSGNSYQLVAVHTGKVLELSGNTTTPGAAIQQWENTNQSSSFWDLIPTNTSTTFSFVKEAESYSSMAGVQAETTTDPQGGGQNIGWIDTNDWMAYSNIAIPKSGNYSIKYRVASPNTGGKLSVDLNAGAIVLGSVDIPNTGGWQNWTTVTQTVYLTAGTYNFGVFAQAGGWNINWFQITSL